MIDEEYVRKLELDCEQLNWFLLGLLAEYESTGNVSQTIGEIREYYGLGNPADSPQQT